MWRSFASLFVGALLPLAFAPFEWWFITPLLVAGYAWLTLSRYPRAAFRRGFAFGAGAFLTGTYWLYHSVVTIGQVPLPLALLLVLGMVAIMAVYFGLNAMILSRIAAKNRAVVFSLLPFIWVITEWLRGWVLSGFPWLALGTSLPGTVAGGWLPIGGVHLGSFVLVSAGSAIAAIATAERKMQRAGAVVLLVLVAVSGVLYDRQWSEPLDDTLRVSIGQLGQDQRLKWDPEQFNATLEWYAQFAVAGADADLILMPEVAIPTVAQRVEGYLNQLERLAVSRGQSVALGILNRPEDSEPSNAMLTLGGDDRQWYEKRHLVPFGEFFPVPSFIRDWMRLKGLPYADIRRGDLSPPAVQVGDALAAVSICYEDAYSGEQLVFFPSATFIINISNDAWFGDTIAPHQHLQIARTRSAESRRWQARATNAGITAIIDDRGRVIETVPAFQPATLNGTLSLRAGHTPYTKIGNAPLLILCALTLLAGGYQVRRGGSGFNPAK
ncbi:MAG: apolipoprotein N-acyltransferase [Pseudomonadota bacterium]